jgi:hypothetical protein
MPLQDFDELTILTDWPHNCWMELLSRGVEEEELKDLDR